MLKTNANLLDLDIEQLFQERSIDEIVEIEKLVDTEIEKKRKELRSMVGDRYKDVLAASDAIKSMKTISVDIVGNIEAITETCENLICSKADVNKNSVSLSNLESDRFKIEERTLIIQIRLAIFINEQIWAALYKENNLEAAQYFLLAQHIQTGLSLAKKEYLDKLVYLQRLKLNLVVLRTKIFKKITEKLESVEITAKETSSNLNALILLQNQSSNELLSIFIEHRKTALSTVINSSYSSVRLQVSAMVRCLITTVLLLHDCFIYTQEKSGLLWQQLNDIVDINSLPTLSKLELPQTALASYIPEIIRQFRPKCETSNTTISQEDTKKLLSNWVDSTQKTVKEGLENSLQSVTNVKGLHLIREESLKCELPSNWSQICVDSQLPQDFDIWYFFFQNLLTIRGEKLICKIIDTNVDRIKSKIVKCLKNCTKFENSEMDLRWYVWNDDNNDYRNTEDGYMGLSMKTKGYSPSIVDLCKKIDKKYLGLLEDVSLYLYGKEYNAEFNLTVMVKDFKFKRKYLDREQIENHLRHECVSKSAIIADFVEELVSSETNPNHRVQKSIICARFIQALCKLCPHLNTCCELNNVGDDWHKICDIFTKTSHHLWFNWIEHCVEETRKAGEQLEDVSPGALIRNAMKWDEIEIQEQTDDKVFKSQIKVPLKPSIPLTQILVKLNNDLSQILAFTLSKVVHQQFIEKNMHAIFQIYLKISEMDLRQVQALQFLFDVRFLTIFCIARDWKELLSMSQSICDKFRSKIDPFDLDVFYSYLQANVKKAANQSQTIFGCLLPSAAQLANLGPIPKAKDQEKVPSLLALSNPSSNSWFPLLPVTVPSQKSAGSAASKPNITKEQSVKSTKPSPKKAQDAGVIVRNSAATLFGGLKTDWFS